MTEIQKIIQRYKRVSKNTNTSEASSYGSYMSLSLLFIYDFLLFEKVLIFLLLF